jgi:hypothetical protein
LQRDYQRRHPEDREAIIQDPEVAGSEFAALGPESAPRKRGLFRMTDRERAQRYEETAGL